MKTTSSRLQCTGDLQTSLRSIETVCEVLELMVANARIEAALPGTGSAEVLCWLNHLQSELFAFSSFLLVGSREREGSP
jgi:hypothetical protein